MEPKDITPFDWQRIWLGDAPPLFLLEILFRTGVMFAWLILLLRVIGKRGLAQLSPLELAIVIALGSAVGDPMFYPEVPMLHAMLVVLVVVLLQRLLAVLVVRSERVETFVEGVPIELARDGQLDAAGLARANLSREDLFERLRVAGVRQLGQVQRAYFEQDGNISVFQHAGQPPPGLPVVPPWDLTPPRALPPGAHAAGRLACLHCGTLAPGPAQPPRCPHCGHDRWTPAVLDPLGGGSEGGDQDGGAGSPKAIGGASGGSG